MIWFGWVLWHINHCWLFNAKFSLYIYVEYIGFSLVGFYGMSTIVGYLMSSLLYTYILNIFMICKHILSLSSFFHTVKWFQVLLYNRHNLTSVICLHTVCSIWPIDRTQSGARIPGESEPGSNGKDGVLYILQSSKAWASPSDTACSNKRLPILELSYQCSQKYVFPSSKADWIPIFFVYWFYFSVNVFTVPL